MKKISTIILSMIMVITLFTGCGKDAADEKASNKETKAKSEVVAKSEAEAKKGDTKGKDEKSTEVKPEEKDETVKEDGTATSSLEGGSENKEEVKSQPNTGSGNAPAEEAPKPEVPEKAPEAPTSKYVTLSITCNTILNNMDKVTEGKKNIIPSNGVILGEIQVEIKDGDTVFDILKQETRNNRIHMDFVETPMYGSAYIKGIANIYEFDAGDLSGWMYSVNGIFPNYGVSKYDLQNGDRVEFKYTCDLGRDL